MNHHLLNSITLMLIPIKSMSQRLMHGFLASSFSRALANCFELGEEVECAICLGMIRRRDKARDLKCQHIFHKFCLARWLMHQGRTCPLCREYLYIDEEEEEDEFEAAVRIIHGAGDCIVFSPFIDVDLEFNLRNAWWIR